jgi:D-alanyl-D-alanine dipeptidase
MTTFDPKTLKKITIKNKIYLVSPVIYEPLRRANAAMLSATGQHIDINNAYRSTETQAALYKKLKAANPRARVAPPGRSFHERGQAIDVNNWQQAEKFLHAEGFKNPLADDKIHFSIGEFNALETTKKATFPALIFAAGLTFIFYMMKKGKYNNEKNY